MGLFVRITLVVALALLVLTIVWQVVHLLFVAAIVAAVVVAALAVARLFRRRRTGQITYVQRGPTRRW